MTGPRPGKRVSRVDLRNEEVCWWHTDDLPGQIEGALRVVVELRSKRKLYSLDEKRDHKERTRMPGRGRYHQGPIDSWGEVNTNSG